MHPEIRFPLDLSLKCKSYSTSRVVTFASFIMRSTNSNNCGLQNPILQWIRIFRQHKLLVRSFQKIEGGYRIVTVNVYVLTSRQYHSDIRITHTDVINHKTFFIRKLRRYLPSLMHDSRCCVATESCDFPRGRRLESFVQSANDHSVPQMN